MTGKEKHDIVFRAIMTGSGQVKEQFSDVLSFLKITPADIQEKSLDDFTNSGLNPVKARIRYDHHKQSRVKFLQSIGEVLKNSTLMRQIQSLNSNQFNQQSSSRLPPRRPSIQIDDSAHESPRVNRQFINRERRLEKLQREEDLRQSFVEKQLKQELKRAAARKEFTKERVQKAQETNYQIQDKLEKAKQNNRYFETQATQHYKQHIEDIKQRQEQKERQEKLRSHKIRQQTSMLGDVQSCSGRAKQEADPARLERLERKLSSGFQRFSDQIDRKVQAARSFTQRADHVTQRMRDSHEAQEYESMVRLHKQMQKAQSSFRAYERQKKEYVSSIQENNQKNGSVSEAARRLSSERAQEKLKNLSLKTQGIETRVRKLEDKHRNQSEMRQERNRLRQEDTSRKLERLQAHQQLKKFAIFEKHRRIEEALGRRTEQRSKLQDYTQLHEQMRAFHLEPTHSLSRSVQK